MAFWSRRARRREAAQPGTQEAAASVVDLLRASGLVDVDWYRATYADVAAAGIDPVTHYIASGADEGRDPNAFFDTARYLAANVDVRQAGVNPLLHYVMSGAAEGRAAGAAFDTAYYVALNPEIGAEGINPLAHYLRFGRDLGRVATPYDDTEAFELGVRAKQQAVTGAAAALFRGTRAEHVHFALEGPSEVSQVDGLPLPPLRLAQRIGSETLEDFESSGSAIRGAIVRALPTGFTWKGARCLDFGSGVGRAIRHFREEAEEAEFWGCDIDGPSIRWSVQNLSPPFRFFQIGETPTIPFEDDSFDFVYAISVLSHIHSTWHQWLMEIRRILKPGGIFMVSFMGQTPMEEMLGESYWDRGEDFGMYVRGPHNNWQDGGPMIFVSPDWIKRFWGGIFDIDHIAMEGLMDYQSYCMMRKPAVGSPIREDVPVLRLGSQQAFDPDATGFILPQVDEQKPYVESYGIEVEAGPDVVVEGWIVFREDAPSSVAATLDGRPLQAEAEFEPGVTYRDWHAPQYAFALRVDLTSVARGRHEFAVTLTSERGHTHQMSISMLIR